MPNFLRLFFAFLLPISLFAQSIVYVTPNGAGDGSGGSWQNVLSGVNLPNRLATATAGTQFWIAAGIYKPTTTTDRAASFSIASGVSVYGGFWAREQTLADRPGFSDITRFSGNIGDPGNTLDNCEHVVTIYNPSQSIKIESIVVSDGNSQSSGAGMHILHSLQSSVDLKIANCQFLNNTIDGTLTGGGAIDVLVQNEGRITLQVDSCFFAGNQAGFGGAYAGQTQGGFIQTHFFNCYFINNIGLNESGAISNDYVADNPNNLLSINKCQFSTNSAFFSGGALTTGSSQCIVENSMFLGNKITASAFTGGGGAVDGSDGKAVFKNCLFRDNDSPRGGAIYSVADNSPVNQSFINCTFVNNSASTTGGVFYNTSPARFTATSHLSNCILWQNSAPDSPVSTSQLNATYSLVQGGYPGIGNLNADPLFVFPAYATDLRTNSPAINAGNPDTSNLPATDLAGKPRVQGGRVDMGAYEFESCTEPHCLPLVIQRTR